MKTTQWILSTLALLCLAGGGLRAQTAMPWYAADGAGAQRSTGTTMLLYSSVAQPCAGLGSSLTNVAPSGYLAIFASPRGTPEMEVVPVPLAFGTVAIGKNTTRTLIVRNIGGAPLRILSTVLNTAHYTFVSGDGVRTVGAGQSADIVIRFTPTAEGQQNGTLRIESNWEAHRFVDVDLTASGLLEAADLVLDPITLDFGNVTIGSGLSKTITARNNGNIGCVISDQNLEGLHASNFQLTNPCSNTLLPGSSSSITIRFQPTAEGTVSARYYIVSNDADAQRQEVQLFGRGVTENVPDIAVTPLIHDFGATTMGSELTVDIQIRNEGQANLELTTQTVSGEGFTRIVDAGTPITPGNISSARIAFIPPRDGVFSGSFTIVSNDPDEGTVTVALTGRGAPQEDARIDLSAQIIDFGSIDEGTSPIGEVTIRNAGGKNLVLTYTDISDHGTYTKPADFSVVQFPTVPLNPSASTKLRIQLSANASCEHKEAHFKMTTNDPSQPYVDILIKADVVTEIEPTAAPAGWRLSQNYPNPFAESAIVEYAIPEAAFVELSIYDLFGRKLRTVLRMHVEPGMHTARIDARALPAGQYYCRLESGAVALVRIMTLLR